MENINVTNYTADVVKKKKKTGVIIGAAAAVLVGGSGVAYAAVPVVHNTVNMTVMSPEKYCIDVYENSIDKCFKEHDGQIQAGKKISGGSFTMTVEPDSDTMSLIESQLGQEIFDKLSISVDAKTGDSSVSGKLSLSADDKEVASANYFGFSESGKIYAQVPGLSEKYLYADCNDLMGDDFSQSYIKRMKKTDPKVYDDYKELMEKYSKEFVKIISKGTSELEKGVEGKVSDVNYKYNQVTTVLKAEDINPFIQDLVKEIKNDENLKGFLEQSLGKTQLQSLYDAFDEINEDPDSFKVESDVTVKTLIDPEGTIRGIDLTQEENQIGFIVAKEGENVAFELQSLNKAVVSLNAVQKDDRYTGTLTIIGEEDEFVFDFEDIEIVDDMYINGSVSTDLSEVSDNKFKTLSLSFKAVENGQNISTEIAGVGKFSVDLLTYKDEQKDVEEPKDAVNFKDIDQYLDGVDTKAYLDDALGKLGFTYDQVESMVKGIESMFGVNNDYDDYNYEDDFDYDGTEFDDFNTFDEYQQDGYVEIEQAVEDMNFSINGQIAKVPAITFEMLPESQRDKTVAAGEFESISTEDSALSMYLQNNSSDTLPIYECELFSITATDANANFSVNSIKVGSTVKDLMMRYPDSNITEDTTEVYISDTSTYSFAVSFFIEDGIVTKINCYFM